MQQVIPSQEAERSEASVSLVQAQPLLSFEESMQQCVQWITHCSQP